MDRRKNNKLVVKMFNKNSYGEPFYASEGASGVDIRADVAKYITLLPGVVSCVPTGIYLEIPDSYECQVRPRSGLSKNGIMSILGTIDSDYRGEIHVLLINLTKNDIFIEPGDKIAQLVFQKVEKVKFESVLSVEFLSSSKRGINGFGSTGVR